MTCTRALYTESSVSASGDCKRGLRLIISRPESEPNMSSTLNDWDSEEGLQIGLESMVGEGWVVQLTMCIACWQEDVVLAGLPCLMDVCISVVDTSESAHFMF